MMSHQRQEPILLNCRFPLDTTRDFFRQWLITYHQDTRCLGFADALPYDLTFLAEFQESGKSVFAFGSEPANDVLESMIRSGHLSETVTNLSSAEADPLIGFTISILPLSASRIEVTVNTRGSAFNHCVRTLLSHIDTNWPFIGHFPCELLYKIGNGPIPVVDEEVTTIASFIDSHLSAQIGRDYEQAQKSVAERLNNDLVRYEHQGPDVRPGRPRLSDSNPDEYWYRLCMAQRILELREQDPNITLREAARDIQWPDRTAGGIKKLERAIQTLRGLGPDELAEMDHRRKHSDGKCNDRQK